MGLTDRVKGRALARPIERRVRRGRDQLKRPIERDSLAFEDSLGDGAQFTTKVNGLRVHCHCDWCGDTESGFGAEVGYDLTLEQAKELYEFLGKWLTPNA